MYVFPTHLYENMNVRIRPTLNAIHTFSIKLLVEDERMCKSYYYIHSSYVFRQKYGSTLWICVTDIYENTISAQKLLMEVCSTLKTRPCPFIQILSQFYPDFIQILSR